MTAVFADTSALYALVDGRDERHAHAAAAFAELRSRRAPLLTTSFVLVETYALLGRRLGLEVLRSFRADFAPLVDVVWIDAAQHEAGLDLLVERRQRHLSLVDAVSFVVMRQRRLTEAFAFGPHFEREGFSVVGV